MRRARSAVAGLYNRVFLSAWPRLRGHLGLVFLRAVYQDLSVGPGARCWGSPVVAMEPGSSITIGRRFSSTSDVRRAGIAVYSPCKLRTMPGAAIVIGDGVSLNGTSITARTRIEIGDGTQVAANVVIVDSDFHPHWPPERRRDVVEGEYDAPVTIGRDVWIGVGSIVLKGAVIGDGAIIGAGSVVTGPIPARTLSAGAPARVCRVLGERAEAVAGGAGGAGPPRNGAGRSAGA